MKIGIITFHAANNFGANLQAYSTAGYLKNIGMEPIVINWLPHDIEASSNLTMLSLQAEAHKKFIRNNLPCSEICRTDEDIVKVIENENIEGIIIGSDAVFRQRPFLTRIQLKKKGIIFKKKPTIDWRFPNPFWGSFISLMKKKIPVVVMSASSQNTQFRYILGSYRLKMKSSLKQFQLITVRDEWTRKMVNYLTNGDIIPSITPDPVFAYNQNIKYQISKKEICTKFNLPDNYLLISFRTENVVSNEWLHSFQLLAEEKDLKCVALTMPDGLTFQHPFSASVEPPLSPEEWYGLIKYSSGYIGENMHPVVVALHNGVPFYSFDSYGIVRFKFFVNNKSSKIYDILSAAGFLENRINILGRSYKSPSPESVFHKIINFDQGRCKTFSAHQLDKYNNMMKNVMSIFVSQS
jgi:hypothetical protein